MAWERVNCNGSIHIIALNTNGRLIFSGHKCADLKRACRLMEAGGVTENKCTCANFYRNWVLGRKAYFAPKIERERFVWNTWFEETDQKTKIKKTVLKRPRTADLLAHRIVWRRRRRRGVVTFKMPALPKSSTVYGDKSAYGIGDDSTCKAIDLIIDQVADWGFAGRMSDLPVEKRPKIDYPQDKNKRPNKVLLERLSIPHGFGINIWLPPPRCGNGHATRAADQYMSFDFCIEGGRFYIAAGTYPHCRVAIVTDGSGAQVYDTTLRGSDGDKWDFRLLCEMLEFKIIKSLINDQRNYMKLRGRNEIDTQAKQIVSTIIPYTEKLGFSARYDTQADDGTIDVELDTEFSNLTAQAARTLAVAYKAFKKRVIDPLLEYSKRCREGRVKGRPYRFPEPPGFGIGKRTPKDYNPQDQLD